MFDLMSLEHYKVALTNMIETEMPVMSATFISTHSYYEEFQDQHNESSLALFYPVTAPNSTTTVGSVLFNLRWESFVNLIFPPGSEYVHVVIENSW